MRYPEITIAQEGEIVRLSAEERIGSRRIAQRVGCTHATVLKILKDPVNRQRVQARRVELLEAAKVPYLRDLKGAQKRLVTSWLDTSRVDEQ